MNCVTWRRRAGSEVEGAGRQDDSCRPHPLLVDLGLLALALKDAKTGDAAPLWINLRRFDSQALVMQRFEIRQMPE